MGMAVVIQIQALVDLPFKPIETMEFHHITKA